MKSIKEVLRTLSIFQSVPKVENIMYYLIKYLYGTYTNH